MGCYNQFYTEAGYYWAGLRTRAHSFVFISRETDNSHSARCDAMQRLKAYTRSAVAVDMEPARSNMSPLWRASDIRVNIEGVSDVRILT